ncbi:MAG: methyltransferase [Deltaproteobacteria bacterium]|nr:MAG: methyltransferase [Deltaproteobacteria bacterium]RLC09360.1 MAG: methyltransferase [Deltaproteobacteria bacterium]
MESMRNILEELQKQYSTSITEIAVAGKRLKFLQANKIDGALEGVHLGETGSAEFPFWLKIWEASVVLANFLSSIQKDKKREWVEIGAGMGVAGIFAAAFGHRVTITDHHAEALKFARANAALNNLKGVRFALLDWEHLTTRNRYDYIIGSEVVYTEKLFEPLMQLFKSLLLPDGTIFLAGDVTRRSPLKFFNMLKDDFYIQKNSTTLRSQDQTYVIDLYRLRFR